MRKNRFKLRKKIYPVIWSGIIVISLYLIVRFSALSFSGNIGQANLSLRDIIFSGLCNKVMEEGAALISYTAKEEEQGGFPIVLAVNEFALQKFAENSSVMTVQAKEYNSLLSENGFSTESDTAVETMDTAVLQDGMNIYKISDEYLSMEYVLTNGAVYNSVMAGDALIVGTTDQLEVGYEEGEVDVEEVDDTPSGDDTSVKAVNADGLVDYTLKQLRDIDFLVRNFYTVNPETKVTDKLFDIDKLLGSDMTLKQDNEKPQILIYHTHAHEAYCDSKSGEVDDTVVGVGSYLAKILEEDYGYNVIHDTTPYDKGATGKNIAYTQAEEGISKILEENPTIEVTIDIHRDSGNARTVVIDGNDTAEIMLFNGLCRDQDGPLTYLDNPNLQDNLAFSFQLQNMSHAIYPGLFIKNYLRAYRYNMHFRPKALLIELGTIENTIESAKNAMPPFAKVLDAVLSGE